MSGSLWAFSDLSCLALFCPLGIEIESYVFPIAGWPCVLRGLQLISIACLNQFPVLYVRRVVQLSKWYYHTHGFRRFQAHRVLFALYTGLSTVCDVLLSFVQFIVCHKLLVKSSISCSLFMLLVSFYYHYTV